MSLLKNRGTIFMTLGLFAAVGLCPFLLRGNAAERALIEKNQARIANMTTSERARLDRNYAAYQAMSEADRSRWRQFHLALLKDQQSNNSRLTKAKDDYYSWLQTISGSRRDELLKETQVPNRLEAIQQIVDAEMEESLNRAMGGVQRQGFRKSIPLLDREQLMQVVDWIGIRLRLDDSVFADDQGEPIQGLDRAIRTLQIAGERGRSLYALWFDRASQTDVVAPLGSQLQEFFLGEKSGDKLPIVTNMQLVESVKLSLLREFELESARSRPADADLRGVLEKLEPEEKDALWNESSQAIVAALQDRYLRDVKVGSIEFNREKMLSAFRPPPEIRQQMQSMEQRLQERDGRRPGIFRIPPERRPSEGDPPPRPREGGPPPKESNRPPGNGPPERRPPPENNRAL